MRKLKNFFYDEEAEALRLTRLFLSIVFIWALSGLVLFFLPNRGEFGDMFGAINTLFSGLAFGGIIYTIFQQKVELRLQRQELELQRQEVKRTNQELANQVEAMNIQRFETTFFNMVSLHHQVVNGISKTDPKEVLHGREVFIRLHASFRHLDSSAFSGILDSVFSKEIIILDHYFNGLAQIVSFIKNSYLSEDQKKNYMNTLSSQLSPAESMVTFYYIVWKETGLNVELLKSLIKDTHYMYVTLPHKEIWANRMQ